ncbi:MAG TPA: hypothetical protein EYN27_01715 [Rhodospirillales bacterium]|nr:hypothetical protein [Rhodospirillales bacterium]HIO37652.1 hypothetical protein [Rhodospirillales bacterium]
MTIYLLTYKRSLKKESNSFGKLYEQAINKDKDGNPLTRETRILNKKEIPDTLKTAHLLSGDILTLKKDKPDLENTESSELELVKIPTDKNENVDNVIGGKLNKDGREKKVPTKGS